MLEFRNVSVSCQHMPILNDISLTFRDGEITTNGDLPVKALKLCS